ncbi:uncharacterized protein LOC142335441 isoform X1 [Convolutriloba macropyga]|uniref:uncharacterized protein LOC142335441 isoform X1 n=1 Tax=Convolutriloba macropyga TaxID=536237 RepID=UPI003F523723
MLSDMFSEQQYEGMTEREQVPNQTEDVSQSCKSEVNKMWESGERIRGSDERLQHDWENASGSSRDVLAPQVETHSDGIVTRTPDQNQFTVDVNGDSKYREQNVATSAQLQSQPRSQNSLEVSAPSPSRVSQLDIESIVTSDRDSYQEPAGLNGTENINYQFTTDDVDANEQYQTTQSEDAGVYHSELAQDHWSATDDPDSRVSNSPRNHSEDSSVIDNDVTIGDEKDDAEEDEEHSLSDVPNLPDIPADLRNRSPNIANLLQRRHSTSKSPAKSPLISTPTIVDKLDDRRSSTSHTTVGVFINGKLSGHSEQRSILTSHYLAINSLGVLSRFHYRLRVTELPDCVAALSNGEVIVADNHSDISRLKFFDCNQRYQRSLPLVDENHNNHNSLCAPYVTDIQLSNGDSHLWIVDSFNQTVREVDLLSGQTLQLWTNHTLERGHKLMRPGKVAISPDRVYVSDAGDETVKAFDRSNGDFLFKFKVGPNYSDRQNSTNLGSSQTSVALTATSSSTTLDSEDNGCPWAIHWTMDETLLIGDIRYDFVYIVDKRGKRLGRFGGSGRGLNKFNGPVAICSDGDGNIAIADAKNGRVQLFTRDMMLITSVHPMGEEGDEVTAIALTADGMLTVIDHLSNQCLIF